eukprot:TRINITY_DN12996_c0_g1_i1.p1 TRINITY_DN12996_c0_g1~~TRINITY_DN12996_c0_g1_i1.p1  ORF type:complete len:348 (+),score=93.41 TRINITY_DN12996_c0_g1_i1:80-1045(+)
MFRPLLVAVSPSLSRSSLSVSPLLSRPSLSQPSWNRSPVKIHSLDLTRSLHTTTPSWARQTARTAVRDQTRTRESSLAEWEAQERAASRTYEEQEGSGVGGDGESQEAAITPGVRKHLTKVYGTMMAGMGFAAVGAAGGMVAPGLAVVGMIGSLVGVLGVAFTDKSKVTLRQNLFLGTAGLMGLSLGPLLAASAPGVIFSAALGTTAIFGGFTLAALRAKRKAMLMMGGPLLGGLLLVLFAGLGGMLLPFLGVTNPAVLAALYNINLYGGLAIFSLFISYDTQRMIEDYKNGDTDHVSPALSMFLNLINIFIRLLQIFRGD